MQGIADQIRQQSDGLLRALAGPTTAGFEDNRTDPSCGRAQVAQRLRRESAAMAAEWNWWFGQAMASRTFTSSSNS